MKNKTLEAKGLLLIFLVPIILVFVFYLPRGVKEMLILHRDYSNFYDILTTHYVHEEFTHLIGNVLTYLGATLILYFFLAILKEKRFFYKIFLTNCLLIPTLISLIWIPTNKFIWTSATKSYGFSGIASAFLGTLIFASILLLQRLFKLKPLYAYLSSTTLITLIFAITYFTFIENTATVLLLISTCFILFTYKTIKSIDPEAKKELIEKMRKPMVVKILPFLLYIQIFTFSIGLFPSQFIQGSKAINFLIHYLGFMLGIGIAYVIHCTSLTKTKQTKN